MHDGRKKITLTPLKSSFFSKSKENHKMDVFDTTVLKSKMHEYRPYKEQILLAQELGLATPSTQPLLTPPLHTFQHVFP